MLDSTQLLSYMDCPEKFRLAFVEGYKKAELGESEWPREFGSAIHLGIACFHSGLPIQEAARHAQAAYTVNVPLSENLYKKENINRILHTYSAYALANLTDWEVLEVEQPHDWLVPVGENTSFLVKSDLRIKRGNDYYAVNFKSTRKYVDDRFWRKWGMHFQTKAEAESVRIKFGSCAGVMLVAIQLGYRTRAWKGEPTGFWCRVTHQELNFNQAQLDDWKVQQATWVEKIIQSRQTEVWGKHESNCNWCEMYEICASVGNPQVVESLYIKSDPLAYQKKEVFK